MQGKQQFTPLNPPGDLQASPLRAEGLFKLKTEMFKTKPSGVLRPFKL